MNRRTSRVLFLLALIVVSTIARIPAAPDAQAAFHNPMPADEWGAPVENVSAADNLFVTGTTDLAGGRVCIVAPDSTADCSKPAWGTVNTITGVGTVVSLIEAAPLRPGTWVLRTEELVDNPNPGPGKPAKVWGLTELGYEFTVRACNGECDTTFSAAQAQRWKAAAQRQMDGSRQVCTAFATRDVLDSATDFHKQANTSTSKDIAKAGKKLSDDVGTYDKSGKGVVGTIVGIGSFGLAQLGFSIPDPLGTHKKALQLLRDVNCSIAQMYADVVADPPDPAYADVAEPVFAALSDHAPGTVRDLIGALDHQAETGAAVLHGFERWQGARDDADAAGKCLQTGAIADYSYDQVAAMRDSAAKLRDYATEIAGDPALAGVVATAAQKAELVDVYERVRTQGFLPEEITELEALGFDADEIARIRASYDIDISALPVGKTLPQILNDEADSLESDASEFDWFARLADTIGSETCDRTPPAVNHAPVSAFSASATSGTAPLSVTFTADATDPDGDALSLRWDIGGTRTVDDQTSVTHVFTAPGTYGVSLVATDPDGKWDQSVKWITVTPDGGTGPVGNAPPVASFAPRWVDKVGPFTQTFTASSYDPDGDALTHTWYFGDGITASGDSVTKTFPAGYVMSVLLMASDGTATAQIAGEVTSRHSDGETPANTPPIAAFDVDPNSGVSPLTVAFTSNSSDPDGGAITETWYFGDGTSATGPTANHTYTEPGVYTATLVVSDGVASTSSSKTVVANQVNPILAGFTVSSGYDAAAWDSGARIIANGVSANPAHGVTNIQFAGTNEWRTEPGVTGGQEVIVHLAGNGTDLLDRIVLENSLGTPAIKTFSVALSRGVDPFGAYDTVIDHATAVDRRTPQTFTFTPTTGRFLKLTAHDNHGSTSHLALGRLQAMTLGGDDGLVSMGAGKPAKALSATSEYSAGYRADYILDSASHYWSSANGAKTDQRIRVALGVQTPHRITNVALRTSAPSNTVTDVEVWASATGDDGDWTKVADTTLDAVSTLQTIPLDTPIDATQIELRMTGTGTGPYLYLYELQVLDPYGLNLARSAGVGAQVTATSGELSSSYVAENAIAPDSTTGHWRSASGQNTDQFITVLLRDGAAATIDRATVVAQGLRPKNVQIRTSLDGTTWTTVASRMLRDTSEVQTIRFKPTEARFVQLWVEDGYAASIRVDKFRVHAVDRGGPTVTFTDISTGTAPVSTWAWDFGDGGTSSDANPTHTFAGPGTYDVTLTVTDVDGGTDTFTRPYTVAALPDAFTFTTTAAATEQDDGTFTTNEGTTVALTAGVTDTAAVAWQWDLGYTRPTTTTATVSAKFPDEGTWVVRFRAQSPELLWSEWQERTFEVANVAPTVTLAVPASALAGDQVRPTSVGVVDPADILTCTWDRGDGTPAVTISPCTTASVNTWYTYAEAGDFTATLTVDDGDGGVATASAVFHIVHRPTFIQIVSITRDAADRMVRARLLDGPTIAPIVGGAVTATIDGTTVSGSADGDGFVDLVVPDSIAGTDVTLAYPGDATRAATSVTRPVRSPRADIVFMVDESGSMGGLQAQMKANILSIVRGLGTALDYRLGLVGYANGDQFANVHSPLTDDVVAYRGKVNALVAGGGYANGYEATLVALDYRYRNDTLTEVDEMQRRPNAASCVVLISDAAAGEADALKASPTGPHADYDLALDALRERNATLYAITVADQATKDAYGPGPGLAGKTGGGWWSINDFANDPTGVLDALTRDCVTKASTPDLAATLTGPTAAVAPGDTVTWTARAANVAAADTTGVVMTATLPAGVTFVNAAGGGVWDPVARTVTWPATTVLAGDAFEREVTVTVDEDGWEVGSHEITASLAVTYDASAGPESTLENNTDSHTVGVTMAAPPETTTTTSTSTTTSTTVPETTTTTTTVPETTTTTTTVPETTTTTTTVPETTTTTSTSTTTTVPEVEIGSGTTVPPAVTTVPDPPSESPAVDPVVVPGQGELPRTGSEVPVVPLTFAGLVAALLGAAVLLRERLTRRRS